MNKTEFSFGVALAARRAEALRPLGGPDGVLDAIVNEIADDLHGVDLSVEGMKALGGWSTIISKAIGEAPDAQVNDLGFATNPKWYVWDFLKAQEARIRFDVQRLVTR